MTLRSTPQPTVFPGVWILDTRQAFAPDVDLEKVPVCECEFVTWKGSEPCDNTAAWWGVNLCCGDRGLYCDSCKHRADCEGDFRYWLNICGTCGGTGMEWVKL